MVGDGWWISEICSFGRTDSCSIRYVTKRNNGALVLGTGNFSGIEPETAPGFSARDVYKRQELVYLTASQSGLTPDYIRKHEQQLSRLKYNPLGVIIPVSYTHLV